MLCDVGCSEHSETYHEMVGTFERFDPALLDKENAIAYKYTVVSGQGVMEECLHSHGIDVRRCLRISKDAFHLVKSKLL